jgi:hypothetical protein
VPAAVVSAIDASKIHASIETTIHTSNPANDLVAASPGTVAAPQRSLFQPIRSR